MVRWRDVPATRVVLWVLLELVGLGVVGFVLLFAGSFVPDPGDGAALMALPLVAGAVAACSAVLLVVSSRAVALTPGERRAGRTVGGFGLAVFGLLVFLG